MSKDYRKIIITGPLGNKFEAEISCGTKLSEVAVDFFEDQDLPMIDPKGRSFRVVIDLINPENQKMKRLNSDEDVCDILQDGDTISITN
ncbi:MAG: hypothetical protein OMM_10654 [Candidatus Magnetoglobus multicellularis str. Araruama]|uniref:Uncharacterized protein n=1 Tax=Candidatus Magnetoglobus multicellularis str. Araruama TaxID=890399 RepID=A0A1V1P0E0_9BACT|nr:MAG: hypothetical protein OMM_10654 [Candidatus Magnetoglobus multicellularis str. Araruama]